MSYNEHKNTESNRRGSKAEINFKKLFESKGYKIREATPKENKLHGFDFHINNSTVNVKSRSKKNRKDSKAQDDIMWVEFKNVEGGQGWLYSEKCVWIAKELENSWLIFTRTDLLKFAEHKCDKFKLLNYCPSDPYLRYKRAGNQDVIAMIEIRDLKDSCKSYNVLKNPQIE